MASAHDLTNRISHNRLARVAGAENGSLVLRGVPPRGLRSQGAPSATLGFVVYPLRGNDRRGVRAVREPRVRLQRPWALLCIPFGESVVTLKAFRVREPRVRLQRPWASLCIPFGESVVTLKAFRVREPRVRLRRPRALVCIPFGKSVVTPKAFQIGAQGRGAHPGFGSRRFISSLSFLRRTPTGFHKRELRGGGLLRSAGALAVALFAFAGCRVFGDSPRADDVRSEAFFENRIRPVLAGTCFRCHGGQKVSGGLRVDARESLVKGGDSGPAIDADDPAQSLLIRAIKRHEDVEAMPPDEPLPARQVADLTAWVSAARPGRNSRCGSRPSVTGPSSRSAPWICRR